MHLVQKVCFYAMNRGGKLKNSPWVKIRSKSGPKKAKTKSFDEFDDGSSLKRVSHSTCTLLSGCIFSLSLPFTRCRVACF